MEFIDRPIWKSYQLIKQYFPNSYMDDFFKQLSMLSESDPEVQSCDGLYIDVMWENLTLSIADHSYSISHKEFHYFDNATDALDYIKMIDDKLI